jgi:hypothetical protein
MCDSVVALVNIGQLGERGKLVRQKRDGEQVSELSISTQS